MLVGRHSLVWLQVLLFCATVYAREFSNGGAYSMSDPGSIALADFNNDGRLDMVTGGNGTVTIRLGKGDGSFSRRSFYSNSTSGTSVVTTDFNGDGNKDIVVAGNEPDVNILLGNGDGRLYSLEREMAVLAPLSRLGSE